MNKAKKFVILCNWKEFGTKDILMNFVRKLNESNILEKFFIVIAPPFPLLGIADTSIPLAAQCIDYSVGTGKVLGECLKSVKCNYVLCGHAECDKEVWQQIDECAKLELSPFIFTEDDYAFVDKVKNFFIIYEPKGFINQENALSPDLVEDMVIKIRKNNPDMPVLYGGSVNKLNAKNIAKFVDGLCIGRASRDVNEVIEIAKLID